MANRETLDKYDTTLSHFLKVSLFFWDFFFEKQKILMGFGSVKFYSTMVWTRWVSEGRIIQFDILIKFGIFWIPRTKHVYFDTIKFSNKNFAIYKFSPEKNRKKTPPKFLNGNVSKVCKTYLDWVFWRRKKSIPSPNFFAGNAWSLEVRNTYQKYHKILFSCLIFSMNF